MSEETPPRVLGIAAKDASGEQDCSRLTPRQHPVRIDSRDVPGSHPVPDGSMQASGCRSAAATVERDDDVVRDGGGLRGTLEVGGDLVGVQGRNQVRALRDVAAELP